MLGNKTEFLDKLKSDRLVVGYELGDEMSQISYCYLKEQEPQTISVTAGAEQYSIPTVLCKRHHMGQWYYGKEALRQVGQNEGILLDHLLELAIRGEMVTVEDTMVDPVALLTLFVKRSLTLLSGIASWEQVEALMFTCENLDQRMIDILTRVAAGLGLKNKKILFQSHKESFYYYMLYQPKELWNHEVLLFDYRQEKLRLYRLECNKKTTPVVVYIETEELSLPGMDRTGEIALEERDRQFLELAQDHCRGRLISAVYLIGDGFKDDWMKESLRFLCQGRRVFRGNNLYSKGACLGIREKLHPTDAGKETVFLGEEKLKANIGMQVRRRGQETYYALLDAGVNWFDASRECEFLLEKDASFELRVTPLTGKEIKLVEIVLDGLQIPQEGFVRIHMELKLKDENTVVLSLQDVGFGELLESSGRSWTEEFRV